MVVEVVCNEETIFNEIDLVYVGFFFKKWIV